MKITTKFLAILLLFLTACNATPTSTPAATPNKSPTKQLTFKNTTVSLTFDDGDADNYTVRETLAKNNLHATFYIVSGFTGTDGYMTEQQLRDLYADGNEIGGHSLSHAELPRLDDAGLRKEICQDRQALLAYGFNVTSFAYPFGHYDDRTIQVVKDCGYNNARIVTEGPDGIPPTDPFKVKAMPYVMPDTRLAKLTRYVTGVEHSGGGWVIFIFHHVCDGCDKFAVAPGTFTEFAAWLGEQQANGLVVKTVGEVVGGEVQPSVNP